MPEPRLLVVRLGSMGDIVHTFPAVAALRQSFPNADIVWLTHPRWVELVASSDLASEIWPVNSRDLAQVRAVLRKIRQQSWTAGIDYQGLWKSALLPFFGGVPRRIGFASATIREFGVPILYTDRVRVQSSHIAEQNGELSLHAGAAHPVGNVRLRIDPKCFAEMQSHLAAQGITRYIVLSPGGGWRSKCWPADRFGELCQKIHEQLEIRCVINYGPGEENLFAAVQQASGDANPLGYNGELCPLMALLSNALCIVGGDTGPLHLAIAVGAPAVALFGPTDPARNGPYPPQPIVLRSSSVDTTYQRSDITHPSLLQLSVDEVFQAVVQRLQVHA